MLALAITLHLTLGGSAVECEITALRYEPGERVVVECVYEIYMDGFE